MADLSKLINSHPNFEAIEAERSAMFARLNEAQVARAKDGKFYLQCLITPASKVDGTKLSAFDSARRPSDEREDWRAMGVADSVSAGVRLRYYADRYDGPLGSGFVLGAEVEHEGQVWYYREHAGPEKRSGPFRQWIEISDGE